MLANIFEMVAGKRKSTSNSKAPAKKRQKLGKGKKVQEEENSCRDLTVSLWQSESVLRSNMTEIG